MRHFEEELQQRGVQVLLVSFGAVYWAQGWQKETQSPFPLLLDPERNAYRAYGLEISASRSWSAKAVWYYLKARLQGKEIPPAQSDPHQLGGDFIVDASGIVRLSHPSWDPVDRPPVENLLALLRSLADNRNTDGTGGQT